MLSWILSPASCAVIGLASLLFLFNFLHSPLNYKCQMQKLWGIKNNNSEKFSRKSVMRKKEKQHCIKSMEKKLTSSDHFKLEGTVILKYFKVKLFLFCTNGSFQLRNVYLKVLKECKETCLPCSGVVAFGNTFTLIALQHFVNVDFLTQVILNEYVC